MKAIVLYNQSLFDIAIQHYGNVQAVFKLAYVNGLNITDALTPGHELELPETEFKDVRVSNYYRAKNIRPATGITERDTAMQQELEGIDYWAIGVDFKVG